MRIGNWVFETAKQYQVRTRKYVLNGNGKVERTVGTGKEEQVGEEVRMGESSMDNSR